MSQQQKNSYRKLPEKYEIQIAWDKMQGAVPSLLQISENILSVAEPCALI